MSIEVLTPNLPESVSDATVVNWHKQAGDSVQKNETLVDLETDKVVLEVMRLNPAYFRSFSRKMARLLLAGKSWQQ